MIIEYAARGICLSRDLDPDKERLTHFVHGVEYELSWRNGKGL